jgi:thioredoxin reductase
MTDTSDSSADRAHRYIIVGGGPAGLQLSYYLQRAGSDYVTLERGSVPGGFFARYPRHRKLISLNKIHTTSNDPEIKLRWDWNSLLNDDPELQFPKFSQEYFPNADVMVEYLAQFQRRHELNVRYDTEVQRIEKMDDGFVVHTSAGILHGRAVIVAAGWGQPFIPAIKGIEHATGYEDMDVDPAAYAGQRVLVIGKGNSAFETAYSMLGQTAMVHLASRKPLRLAWNTKHPGDVRGQYGALLDSYQFKTLHSVLDCEIEEITPVGDKFHVRIRYTHADDERELLEYESVLRCTGFKMDTSIFADDIKPVTVRDDRLPALRADWQSANVDDLYFAGTIGQDRDFKKASSPFIDGFRYNLRTMTELLREKYEGVPLRFDTVVADPDRLTQLVLDRVNWSSALWTQFEYLCDAFVVDERTGLVRHYTDLPEDYAVERFADAGQLYTAGLRWGRSDYADVFAIERHPQPDRASESAFIHPVVRAYQRGRLTGEKHLLEDLLAQWRRPDRHVAPLEEFFKEHLAE